MGGSIASFDFAFGDTDAYVIAEMPDQITAASVATAVAASGAVNIETVADLGRGHRSGDREERPTGPWAPRAPVASRRAAPARSPVARRVACRGTTARASSAAQYPEVLHLADELGRRTSALHRGERQVVDRRLRSHERLELLLYQVVEHPSGEPRADLTDLWSSPSTIAPTSSAPNEPGCAALPGVHPGDHQSRGVHRLICAMPGSASTSAGTRIRGASPSPLRA